MVNPYVETTHDKLVLLKDLLEELDREIIPTHIQIEVRWLLKSLKAELASK